ncbi:TetR/AcrR family transcriptional regulator [Echinicola strongylocentroti]|uniref:TetR/AcrR family transcriptional regulator n=1 Tax=Echinicola strongylocentroti TaxID=1795355 RepID=A0A2Z4IJ57_9BACT|nr:TetR/AcrR family transcriptional regulator [Echinicola strongylocentroti]AWW30994.1 TetR/AcrR family transcriptional regulator [Echinicola strongylocentroti]
MARKIPDGEFRNKERTKLKLIDAVGEIIRRQGYTKLGVNNIANTAGVSKKLIYRYFETADKLIETYVKRRDYWMGFENRASEMLDQHKADHGRHLIENVLKKLYEHMSAEPEAQKIILWEISEHSTLMREISERREAFGSEVFGIADEYFKDTSVDIRAITGLMLGGIYYQILHSNATGGSFCEIENEIGERRDRLFKSIENILEWAYNEAREQKKS